MAAASCSKTATRAFRFESWYSQGASEEILGRWLKAHNGDDLVIATRSTGRPRRGAATREPVARMCWPRWRPVCGGCRPTSLISTRPTCSTTRPHSRRRCRPSTPWRTNSMNVRAAPDASGPDARRGRPAGVRRDPDCATRWLDRPNRLGQDRASEAAGSERSQEERVPTLQREVKRLPSH
jgi:hypothetical protein